MYVLVVSIPCGRDEGVRRKISHLTTPEEFCADGCTPDGPRRERARNGRVGDVSFYV